MSTPRTLVAAAVLAVVGVAIWLGMRELGTPANVSQPTDSPAATPVAEPATHTPRPRRAAETSADETAAATSDADLPPPVDLETCDRDLDLFGIVVDANGKGVAGARVATVTYPWRVGELPNVRDRDVEVAGPATKSARDGTFALRLARGDAVSLRVAADGFAAVERPSVLAGERVRVTLRPGVRLVVVLTDSDGKPAEGANVRLFNNDHGGPLIYTRGVSDATGVATFESLPPGLSLTIAPEHPRAIGSWTKIDLPASGELRKEIKLPAGRTITGTVRDATTRSAVAGARVGMNWTLHMAVTTKDDGSYELPGWTGSGIPDINVLAEGYAREAKVVGSAEHIDFDLQRGYAVTGRVVDPNSKVVAGALVSLIASEMQGREQRMSHAYATSDAEGWFRVTSLRVGMKHTLIVTSPGFARLRRDTPVAETTDDVALGDVVLAAPRRVEGVVLGADGAPQARVGVTLAGPNSGSPAAFGNSYGRSVRAFTDDLGRFRFADVGQGVHTLTASNPGAPASSVDVTVLDADLLDVKVARAATRELVFTVVDSVGHPVADVALQVSDSAGKSVQGRTDAQGVGRVGVSPHAKVQFHVWPMSDARKFVQMPQRDVREDESQIRVVLEDGAEVTGRVVDPDGAPVAGAYLNFKVAGDGKPIAQTDAEGRFRAVVPANGRSTLDFTGGALRSNKYEDTGLMAHVEDIAPGADVVVRCERIARDRKLTVVVVSPDDVPVEAATVNVSSGLGFSKSAKTDAQGRAVVEGLPGVEVYVNAWFQAAEFLAPAGVRVTPAGQELRLVCRRASRITGTVVDENGTALTAGGVEALRDDRYVGSAQIDRDGRFALLLPVEDTAPVRLQVTRARDKPPEIVLDGVLPGARDVRLVVRK